MTKLVDIEGIGPAYAAALKQAGVDTAEELLQVGGTPEGRATLAEQSGVSAKLILEWVNHVDLMRINGVGSEYADLLEAAGVDSVPELAQRNWANLAEKLASVNDAKALVRKVPTEAQVTLLDRRGQDPPQSRPPLSLPTPPSAAG